MIEASEDDEPMLDQQHASTDVANEGTSEPISRSPGDARLRGGRGAGSTSNRPAAGRKITRTDVNFWLDTSLLFVFLALVFVTVVLRFVFPSVEDADQWRLWSGTMTEWLDAQFAILSLLTLGIVLHLMLHWTWICGVITQRILPRKVKGQTWDDGMRTIFGVGLMIVIFNILGALIAAAALMIQHP